MERRGEWEVAVNIETSIDRLDWRYVEGQKGFGSRLQKLVLSEIRQNRQALLEEWQTAVQETEHYQT